MGYVGCNGFQVAHPARSGQSLTWQGDGSRTLPVAQGCLWESVSVSLPSGAAVWPPATFLGTWLGMCFLWPQDVCAISGMLSHWTVLPGLLRKAFRFHMCSVLVAGGSLSSRPGHTVLSLALSRVLLCLPHSPPLSQVSPKPICVPLMSTPKSPCCLRPPSWAVPILS